MARFIQLLTPILQASLPGGFNINRSAQQWCSHLLAWFLVVLPIYYSMQSRSALLLGAAAIQLAFSLLILLETILRRINTGPLESRRLEMTAYCLGGALLLLFCVYQFSEAFVHLKRPTTFWNTGLALSVFSSISGNLILVRMLWRSGLFRRRIRAVCRPLLGIFLFDVLCLLSSLTIMLTNYIQIDAWISIVSSILLFVITSGMMIDAYWHLAEVESRGLTGREDIHH